MTETKMTAPRRWFWFTLGAVSIFFHLYLVFSGMIPHMISRPIHMALAAPWVLVFIAKTARARLIGSLLTGAVIACCTYIVFNESQLADQYGALRGNLQLAIAVTLLLITLEMARRCISWPLPAVAVLALAYGLLGKYIPGEFGYPGLPVKSFLGTLTIAEGGLWGQLTGVSVEIVSIFVIMGAVLNAGEAGQGFMNLATAVAGRLKGGAAKVSVLSSALFGSISGSASANVASTGAITLPAMTKLGYPRALAGAVEAVASSGGQIMPPLMGAGAFVMVELTGVPYNNIMGAALLPALLYFMTVWVGINAFTLRYDLKGVARENQPNKREVFTTAMFFVIPFMILLERMFVGGYTPQYAACVAILAAFLLLFVDIRFSFSLPRTVKRLQDVGINSGKQISTIASIIICASIVIGVLGQTGLGIKITSLILSGSGHYLWPALLLTGLACLVLGMEVPTTAAYVICISVAGPALQELGLDPLIAHLFVFWFALLSTITPPVCGAVFIAAGMVGENWLKIAGNAMALGVGLYLIPLGMVANPALIKLFVTPIPALLVFIKLGVSLAAVSYGIIAPKAVITRVALILFGLIGIFI
ncbi:MAG: TRAP transporter fused permease subunit [Desulfuromusa sp.]|nr:TRAP transporter fused permease subunit [Desulfuromusa sp.]